MFVCENRIEGHCRLCEHCIHQDLLIGVRMDGYLSVKSRDDFFLYILELRES
jgi:hypothetical protein